MSKQAQEEGGGLKSDLLDKEREIIRLKAELEETKASNKRLSTDNSKLRKKGSVESSATEQLKDLQEKSSATEHHKEEPKGPKEPEGGLPPAPGVVEEKPKAGMHIVKSWSPRYCPDCGTKNPEFKDEVQCHNCKVGLGGVETVKAADFKVCPNCGKGKDNGGGWEYVPGFKAIV